MIKEMDILNDIRLHLSQKGIITFRANVGKVRTPDGRYFDTGLPKGFSDLLAIRPDGVACFIEVKRPRGRVRQEQCKFLLEIMKHNCPAGIAFNVQDAFDIVEWKESYKLKSEVIIRSYMTKGVLK